MPVRIGFRLISQSGLHAIVPHKEPRQPNHRQGIELTVLTQPFGQFLFTGIECTWMQDFPVGLLGVAAITNDQQVITKISVLLGHAASKQQVKGEIFVGKVTGRSRIAKTGMWRLEATDATPEDLDGQIAELLGKLTGDRKVWEHSVCRKTPSPAPCKIGSQDLRLCGQQCADAGEDE
jgi:hypothetical protein